MPFPPDPLASLLAQGAPESHLARLQELVTLARSEPTLLAIVLVGSYAKGTGDRVSDLDLVAIASPGCGQAVLQAAHEQLARGEVLNQFSGSHSNGGVFWKLVYLDFASVEFHVFEAGTTFRLKRPYLPIWDPNNVLLSYVADGEPVRHEDFPAYEYGDEGLVWELVDCIKWLSRGRTELAHGYIMKLAAELSKRQPNT
jgi:Nucleotidyltransferase domain